MHSDREGFLAASHKVALEELLGEAASVLRNVPECPKATTQDLRAATAELTRLLVSMAALSPAPSLAASEVLHRASCRLYKRADQCRHPNLVPKIRWTAQGYFGVMAELARGLAFAQSKSATKSPRPVAPSLNRLHRSLARASDPGTLLSEVPDEWRRNFDAAIRMVASLTIGGQGELIREAQKQFEATAQDLEPSILEYHHEYPAIGRVGSWVDAFRVALKTLNHLMLSRTDAA